MRTKLIGTSHTWFAACGRLFVRSPPGSLFWLSDFVLSDQVLNKVIFAETCVVAISNVASPILELSVAFILMPNPISFTLERFRFLAVGEGTCEGLNILMYVLCPVGRLVELFHLEA